MAATSPDFTIPVLPRPFDPAQWSYEDYLYTVISDDERSAKLSEIKLDNVVFADPLWVRGGGMFTRLGGSAFEAMWEHRQTVLTCFKVRWGGNVPLLQFSFDGLRLKNPHDAECTMYMRIRQEKSGETKISWGFTPIAYNWQQPIPALVLSK